MHAQEVVCVAFAGLSLACGSATTEPAGNADSATPAADAAIENDASVMMDAAPPRPMSRGWKWVRENPMFISGLTVVMSSVDANAATDYLDGLHANAVHTWATGLPAEIGAWQSARPGVRWVSWVDQTGNSLSNNLLLGGTDGGFAGRIGYQVGDEPSTQHDYDQIVSAIGAIRTADPDALTIVNYTGSPNPSFLDQHATVAKADIYSFDNYTRHKDAYASLSAIRAAGMKYGLPYWRYMRAYIDKSGAPAVDDSDCRWDAFSGLVYGFTGHTWFVYQSQTNPDFTQALFASAGSFGAPKTSTFGIVAQIDLELAHLGRAITQLTSTDVRYIPAASIAQPKGTVTWSAGAGGDPFITNLTAGPGSGTFPETLVGFFVDADGDHYVMIQNVRHAHAEFPITGTQPLVAQVDLDFGSSGVDQAKVLSLSRTTGAVEELALTPQGGTKARLLVTLEAGNVVLFKYATGRPFVLGP